MKCESQHLIPAQEVSQEKPAVVSVASRITEEIRRTGSNEHAGFGVGRKVVDGATRRVLRKLVSAPVSPEDSQAMLCYMFERLGWI